MEPKLKRDLVLQYGCDPVKNVSLIIASACCTSNKNENVKQYIPTSYLILG